MKAIISSTYDSKYLFFIPIVTWCWNKLGVDVVCFIPELYLDGANLEEEEKLDLISKVCKEQGLKISYNTFSAPEHKEATYAQCLRTYAAALDLPEDEILCTSDVDMALFQIPPYISGFTVFGSDLVPPKQYPICYISAKVKDWRNAFEINGRTYQQCIDDLLGDIEAQEYRGNFWAKDQENAYNKINLTQELNYVPRSNGQNQWATKRYDRDDSYILDRLSSDTIDFHMNRPGYEDKNFEIILTILKYHFPDENFQWLIDYTNAYKQLL